MAHTRTQRLRVLLGGVRFGSMSSQYVGGSGNYTHGTSSGGGGSAGRAGGDRLQKGAVGSARASVKSRICVRAGLWEHDNDEVRTIVERCGIDQRGRKRAMGGCRLMAY
ncbi:hypothetical protein BCR44DRAFT_1437442 [Catenaria anguillulae PL171]|uniref:Uncharacterized protein n=1 Tax=Catenaria anguillulae PL171 TaxID=765915 RepID=A0A1Y2HJH1_9FUNG|nr:hypothetical protein BCR44DRAFT_1437442 [Catenaria anguillulae PL171]